MCNFTHMETTPAALPVPPLTEEQKAQLKPWAEQALADRDKNGSPALARLLACGVPEIVLHYEALIANYKRREAGGLDTWLVTKQFIADQGNELNASKSEASRLSHLLEEERRTGGELRGKVTSLLEDLANGCVPVKMGAGVAITPYWRGVNTERANGLAWAELKCKELGIDWPIKPIPYKGGLPEPAPTCQRDCQKCGSRSVIDQNPEIIGFYETSGLPVREGDDYVTDVEGCYLTRAEADELAQEAAAGGAGVGLQGEEGGGRGE